MKKLVILIGLAASAACSGGKNGAVTLSARLGAPNGQALTTANGAAQVASGIEVTRVRVVIRNLRLEREDDKTETKFAKGPLLLDVKGSDLDGALVQLLVDTKVPAGTYDKLKLEIHTIESAPLPEFKELVDQGVSLLIEGTIDTKPFTFASALEAELEHEGRFQLGGTANNITLNIDASKWFTAADGSRLSPVDTTATAREAILANIRSSFSAFEDDDEDGEKDEVEDGGIDDGDHGEADAGDHGEHDGGHG
jgi:hypothetical protein